MHDAPWTLYAPESAAHQLWELLAACAGRHMWVYANKLLARKRPQLLPVYDGEVRKLLGHPRRYWACLWTWFAVDRRRIAAVTALRADVGSIEDISLLRCLDVLLWMRATERAVTAAETEAPTPSSGARRVSTKTATLNLNKQTEAGS